jgi:hypothetical protein
MNIRFARRILAAVMAASLLLVPLTAGATDTPKKGGSDGGSSEPQAPVEEVVEPLKPLPLIDGPVIIQNKLPGAFMIPVNDPAISTIAFGDVELGGGIRPFVFVYSISRPKSPAAYASMDAAAESLGGKTVGGFNVVYGYFEKEVFKTFPDTEKTKAFIKIKNFDPNATYYIVKVTNQGVIEVIPIKADQYGVASFEVCGGLGAYGLIKL